MSSPESDQVLNLLKELSVLKEIDSEREGASKQGQRSHQERHQEIVAEIKALAEQKKNLGEQSHSPEIETF